MVIKDGIQQTNIAGRMGHELILVLSVKLCVQDTNQMPPFKIIEVVKIMFAYLLSDSVGWMKTFQRLIQIKNAQIYKIVQT